MPWCPKCKEEYKEGIFVCPDCKVDLVDNLENEKNAENEFVPVFTFETKDLAEKFASYLNYSGIIAIQEDAENDNITISVREKDIKKAKKYFSAFYSVETSNALAKEFEEMKEATTTEDNSVYDWSREDDSEYSKKTDDEEIEKELNDILPDTEPYEKRSDKANDSFSTSIIFMVFGVVGIVIVALSALGIIKFLNGPVFFIVSTLLFLGFIFVGITSFKSYKKYKEEAAQEEELTKQLNEWLAVNFTRDDLNELTKKIDAEIPDASQEIKYFRISSEIKALITGQFGEIDGAYLDYIAEDFFSNTFGNSIEENKED